MYHLGRMSIRDGSLNAASVADSMLITGIQSRPSIRPPRQLLPVIALVRLRRGVRCQWQFQLAQGELGRCVSSLHIPFAFPVPRLQGTMYMGGQLI